MTTEGDSDSDHPAPAAGDPLALLIQKLQELNKKKAELEKFQRILLRLCKYFEKKVESYRKKMDRILESVPEHRRPLILQAMAKNLSECVASDSDSDSDSGSDEMDE